MAVIQLKQRPFVLRIDGAEVQEVRRITLDSGYPEGLWTTIVEIIPEVGSTFEFNSQDIHIEFIPQGGTKLHKLFDVKTGKVTIVCEEVRKDGEA